LLAGCFWSRPRATQKCACSRALAERPHRLHAQPTFAKATVIGDFYVNGKAPPINGYF
jgi:hypothetical protein